jgi:hypothetical protein
LESVMIAATRIGRRLAFGVAAAALISQPAFAQAPVAPPPPEQTSDDADSGRDVVVITGIGPARTSDELIASTTVLDQGRHRRAPLRRTGRHAAGPAWYFLHRVRSRRQPPDHPRPRR